MLIQVFEWSTLKVADKALTEKQFVLLVKWQDTQRCRYFEIKHRAIRFTNWVGVIQVGKLVIEVLPKASAVNASNNEIESLDSIRKWKTALINMLVRSKTLKFRNPKLLANLDVAKVSLFDILFEQYLIEVEGLFHKGIIKKYIKTERNNGSLKGKLLVHENLQKNIIHKERFYTAFDEYTVDNLWNRIIYNGILKLADKVSNPLLRAKAKEIEYAFPDWRTQKIESNDFDKLQYSRNSQHYKPAIELAKLILLDMNPITSKGDNQVISLFYDMNLLWESWLLATLKNSYKDNNEVKIIGKKVRTFWESKEHSLKKVLETDILISRNDVNIVLDAKWKIPKANTPDDGDIKQMFAYNRLWDSNEAWLCYPKVDHRIGINGQFSDKCGSTLGMHFFEIFKDNCLVKKLELPI